IILLSGEVVGYRHDTDRELIFRQESNFYYLSGCSVPSSLLLAVYQPGASTPSVELFIPKAQLADIMWSVPPPSLEEASEKHDVSRVAHPEQLPEAIASLLKSFPGSLFHTLPKASPLFPALSEGLTQPILATEGGAVTDAYLLSALHHARLTKDPDEIAEIRKANEISSRAHEVVMRVLGQAKEAEAEAIFVASCRREGSIHQAYPLIVAASTRASTLHYCCNDREFSWGPELDPQVLLIDAGCEWNCYASDITRTMPVGNSGKFTPEARAIYELVLKMQKLSFEALKPGLHWDAIQLICHQTLVQGFQALGIFKSPSSPGSGSWNSEEAILASGISAAFFPHGVGHSLGMDVHDVPSASKPVSFYTYLRLRLPLKAGMVVTVEPGIYFSPHLLAAVRGSKHIDHDVLKRYESVGGVRIEDVVVITETGHENLTTVRSDVEWVEAVCSGNA
ncbi:uncharacterized protein LACBIDRAFT_256027, partial [Laccaria bicolor S238N-H82]